MSPALGWKRFVSVQGAAGLVTVLGLVTLAALLIVAARDYARARIAIRRLGAEGR